MRKKESSFTDGLRGLLENVDQPPPEPFKQGYGAIEPRPVESGTPFTAPSRIGRKAVSGYFESDVRKQFKGIAAEKSLTQEALLAFCLNLGFIYFGKDPIASSGDRSRRSKDPVFQKARQEHMDRMNEFRRVMMEKEIELTETYKLKFIERQRIMDERIQRLGEKKARLEQKLLPKE